MSKRSGPNLELTIPVLAHCKPCRGQGKVKPMFYERVCDDCGGSGRVDADTGERIPDELMLVAMLREIHRLNGVIADLRRAASDECPIYGTLKDHPGGGKYRGD